MYDICCIGHITLDKIVTPGNEVHMPGGTSFYFSNAIRNMDVSYHLVTALAVTESALVASLRAKEIDVSVMPSKHTVFFENIYPAGSDHRIQKVSQKADAFTVDYLAKTEALIFHLGPLLADDIPAELIIFLASKGAVSLDVQGYLREVRNCFLISISLKQTNRKWKCLQDKQNRARLQNYCLNGVQKRSS
jgi:sugar/nucleoside kinase (ribokinase family)